MSAKKTLGDVLWEACMGCPPVAAADDIHGIRARWEARAEAFVKEASKLGLLPEEGQP